MSDPKTIDRLDSYERMVNDPWEFLKAVRTLDQVDSVNPVKHSLSIFPKEKMSA